TRVIHPGIPPGASDTANRCARTTAAGPSTVPGPNPINGHGESIAITTIAPSIASNLSAASDVGACNEKSPRRTSSEPAIVVASTPRNTAQTVAMIGQVSVLRTGRQSSPRRHTTGSNGATKVNSSGSSSARRAATTAILQAVLGDPNDSTLREAAADRGKAFASNSGSAPSTTPSARGAHWITETSAATSDTAKGNPG